MWRWAAIAALLLSVAGDWPSPGPAAAAVLSGTILVCRATGVVLVDPLSGDVTLLASAAASASAQGVAWSAERQQIGASVRMRQAGERAVGADLRILDAGGAEVASIVRDRPEVALLSPAWLPTGELAYERADVSGAGEPARIEASPPDGAHRRVLVANAHLPGPAPDGLQLAYVAPGQPFDRLMVQDLTTGDQRIVLDNVVEGFAYFSRPRFSPDGQHIAFGAAGGPGASGMPGVAGGLRLFTAPRWHGPGWDVWTINVDGSGLHQVTHFEYEDDLAVAWSPDGEWLAAFGPNALYLVPVGFSGPATPIAPGGRAEPDWAAAQLPPLTSAP